MQPIRVLLLVALLITVAPPALAQQATPVPNPDFGVAESLPPLALYDALLTTPLPDELLPAGIDVLPSFEWRDSNDPDLAGSIGGVIYADVDPFGSELPKAITYLVFPDANGPRAPMDTVLQYGEPAELRFEGQVLPAGRANLGGLAGLFIVVDNVLLYGMAPSGEDADETAEALTAAGLQHLLDIAASTRPAATPAATPIASAARSAQAAFLAVAAAPFPSQELPFEVGELVVLPMFVSSQESAGGLIGSLLVRDADRTYPYPLATYRFYEDEAAAQSTVGESVPSAGTATPVDLPQTIALPYPTDIIHRSNDTTSVLVQVGSTVVSVETSRGDRAERRAAALELAQIAVRHLEDVTGRAG